LPRGCHRHAWIRGSLFASSVTKARLTWPRFCIWFPSGFTPRLFDFAQSTAKRNTVEILAGDCNVLSMVEGGRLGRGRDIPAAERVQRIEVLDVYRDAASVKVATGRWIDYMHFTKLNGQWRVLDVVLQYTHKIGFIIFQAFSQLDYLVGQLSARLRRIPSRFPRLAISPPPASRKKRGRTPQMTSI
jgi:hypothetical protein